MDFDEAVACLSVAECLDIIKKTQKNILNAFIISIIKKRLDICKALYDHMQSETFDNSAFLLGSKIDFFGFALYKACISNFTDGVKWLLDIGVDIHWNDDSAFFGAFYNENFILAEFIYKKAESNINAKLLRGLFVEMCKRKNKNGLEWLKLTGKISQKFERTHLQVQS